MTYIILYLITNLFSTYILYKFIAVFFDDLQSTLIRAVISYIAYYVLISAIYLIIDIPIIVLLCNLILIFRLTLNYKASLKNQILATIFIYTIFTAIETVVVLLTGYADFSMFESSGFESLWGIIVIKMISYIVVLILGYYKKTKNNLTLPSLYWISIIFIPLTVMFLVLSLLSSTLPQTIVVIGVSLLLTMAVISFRLYDTLSLTYAQNMDKELLRQQNRYYNNQLELMKSSVQKNKGIKHDIINHLLIIEALVKREEIGATLEYIEEINHAEHMDGEYSQTGVMILDSILNCKIGDAMCLGIEVNLQISVPETLIIHGYDIMVILGNLLDNAIDACMALDSSNRKIDLLIEYKKGCLIMHIKNSYKGDKQITANSDLLLTTKSDAENHGIGLKQVRKTLEKYNGELLISTTKSLFIVQAFLYFDN